MTPRQRDELITHDLEERIGIDREESVGTILTKTAKDRFDIALTGAGHHGELEAEDLRGILHFFHVSISIRIALVRDHHNRIRLGD